VLQRLQRRGFDLRFTYHADAILSVEFPMAALELCNIAREIKIPISELVSGGGGETKLTQRLRRKFTESGWPGRNFEIKKSINDQVTQATSHAVDHVKEFPSGTIVLEIEWNNKDPFFDRDLENFNRLHADGAISLGVILTRGSSLQDGIEGLIRQYAHAYKIDSDEKLQKLGIERTRRQLELVRQRVAKGQVTYTDAWAKSFKDDKFGMATTHWSKLMDRLDRGMGSPCPIVAIGIPLSVVDLSELPTS
jgi:Restriction endonuclease BglII